MRCLAHAYNFVNKVFTITRCIIQDLHSNLAAITNGSSINNSKSSFPNHFRKRLCNSLYLRVAIVF
uniref:Uncharacterized protein n=1 Tax=Brassica oleracea var. oleracea TaxID=109376 RepID=A0A0D3ANE7_BRAOL